MAEEKPKTELTTWQEIGTYLGVTDRTVQIWAKKYGLPVSKIAGRAYATTDDLDRWKLEQRETVARTQRPQPDSIGIEPSSLPPTIPHAGLISRPPLTSRPLIMASAAVVIGIAIIVFSFIWLRQPQPSSYTIEGRLVTIFDDRNRKIWEHVFPEQAADRRLSGPKYDQFKQKFADITGDGRDEFFIGVNRTLYCFNPAGRVLWTHQMGREVSTKRGPVPVDYYVTLVATLSKPNRDGGRIVVGGYRGPGALFLVDLLTTDGRKVGEYFHFGWFFGVATGVLDQEGSEDVFLAGVDNVSGNSSDYGATLVVLDPDRFSGQASTLAADSRALVGVPPANEKALLFIKEFAPNPEPHGYCRGRDISVGRAFPLEVTVTQGENQPFAHFRFDRKLKVLDILPELKLLDILQNTILKNTPPGQWQEVIRRSLDDIRYVRNEFDR